MESPPRNKGKGQVPALEEVLGEVTGVICDLCNRKEIPCQWGKVSLLPFFFLFWSLISFTEDSPCSGLPGLSASLGKVPSRRSEVCSVETDKGGGEPGGGA